MCSSQSGDYIFVGRPDGLSVISAKSNETIDEWKDEKMDIVEVTVQTIDGSHCLITTIDDMGKYKNHSFTVNRVLCGCNLPNKQT